MSASLVQDDYILPDLIQKYRYIIQLEKFALMDYSDF